MNSIIKEHKTYLCAIIFSTLILHMLPPYCFESESLYFHVHLISTIICTTVSLSVVFSKCYDYIRNRTPRKKWTETGGNPKKNGKSL